MVNQYDEKHYVEIPFLLHLKSLGWEIYTQQASEPEETFKIDDTNIDNGQKLAESIKLRDSFREVFLENQFKSAVRRMNPWIEEDQVDEVFNRLSMLQENSIHKTNEAFHFAMVENMTVSEDRKTGRISPSVKIVDFENPDLNSFIAISQFKVNVQGTQNHIIPDIVLFLNGMPIVVVECKSPNINEPIGSAVDQLMDYMNSTEKKSGNEKLFFSNIFCIATSMQEAKYGTITSDYGDYVEWKDPYPYTLSDIPSNNGSIEAQDIMIQGMLSRKNILDILHTYTLFRENFDGRMMKIVPRYQQFRTSKKIFEKVKNKIELKDRGGIVWHTQGSGKSLTMMFSIRELYHHPETAGLKVVLLTDRRDLERQLKDTASSVGYHVNTAKSVNDLKRLLQSNTPEMVMGMMHKFQEREFKETFPILNKSEKILIMIDEAHRTQYKLLGANLEKALPNAVRVALTGTPIGKTERTFGDYIDKYTMKQAVEDGVIVNIVYEGRTHQAELTTPEEANRKFEDVFVNLDDDQKKIVMGKYTKRAYLEAEEVIMDKARDMLDHYFSHVYRNGFKAQVVAASRRAAVRYKKAFDRLLSEQEYSEQIINSGLCRIDEFKVEVVISGGPHEGDPEISEFVDESSHDPIIRSFNLPFCSSEKGRGNGNVGIIVVNEMLITGFDAPIEQVMYLDNVIKGHNLLQAIARVNRVYKNKATGYVVDYVGVTDHLKDALSVYMQDDIDQISGVFFNKAQSMDRLKASLSRIEEFFRKHSVYNWKNEVDNCIDILVDEIDRSEFNNLVRIFMNSFDRLLPDKEVLPYLPDLKTLSFIRATARNRYRDERLSIRDASNKIRAVVEEYLISKGVNQKVSPVPLFSDAFKKEIENKKPKERADELRFAIKEYIVNHMESDPEMYSRFSDILEKILQEYRDNWDRIANELEGLKHKIEEGRKAESDFGLDPSTEMPFFGLLKQIIYPNIKFEDLNESQTDRLVSLTRDIVGITERESRVVDFWDNNTKVKGLRKHIVAQILQKEPELFDKRNEIAQTAIELAYNVMRRNHDT